MSATFTPVRRNAAIALFATLAVILTSACGADAGQEDATATETPGAENQAPAEERFSPLIINSISPDPIPVTGTDQREHLVYELEVQNASPRPATVTKVETMAGDDVIATLEGPQITALSMITGDFALPPIPADVIPPGRSVLMIMQAVFDEAASVPSALEHRFTATFGEFEPNQGDFAVNNFPDEITETGGIVTVGDGKPELLGPPLTGGGWVAVNGCCDLSPHRGAMLPVGGRINGSERYAADWTKFDLDAEPLVDFETGRQATFSGDPTDNASYFAFGQPVLAVADGTVVTAVNDLENAPPGVFLNVPLGDLGGNRVILKIRDGVYVLYAHLKQGSLTVKEGDVVKRGQTIAEVGNSGNTSEAHLHCHLMDSPLPLTATNLPWELESFDFEGDVAPEAVDATNAGERTAELPLQYSAIAFAETE